MRVTLRSVGGLLLVWLLVAAVGRFWLPITALAWHFRHGESLAMGEYAVPVPTWWHPDEDRSPASLQFRYLAHNITGGFTFGDMTFQVGKTHSAVQFRQSLETARRNTKPGAIKLAHLISPVKETRVDIAGQPSVCFEVLSSIECLPENQDSGLTADFKGTPAFAPLFYETLAKITKTNAQQK